MRRFIYTEPWRLAKVHVAGWMADIGLATRDDAVGNLYGKIEGSAAGRAILTGSHIDTVIDGGRYDGALGVIASVTAIEALVRHYGRPRRTVEVLVTCDEEGGRFRTDFWGARAVTGEITTMDADRYLDEEGLSLAEAMRAAGYDPTRVVEARRDDVEAWLELHIEQGKLLEAELLDVGIVTAIAGHVVWEIRVTGREDHAGTAPMDLRRDPMAGVAEMINDAVEVTKAIGRPAVCTFGRISVLPGIANVVPESVIFSLDLRDEDGVRFDGLVGRIEKRFREIASARRLGIDIREFVRHNPTPMDGRLVELLSSCAKRTGRATRRMPSMAGHDSEVMANRWPSAMLFVPSKDGRSHTPAEFTPLERIVPGVEVLASALYHLAYAAPDH
jgi:allantoate deiminase